MVSTRLNKPNKYKFSEGEKILCYEPDPQKSRILYIAKIISINDAKDKRGKAIKEYMIHFQGWNSSWDRLVSENFILKDTKENRQLQRELAEKSQLQIGAYLYRKERKKRRKLSEKIGLAGQLSETDIQNRSMGGKGGREFTADMDADYCSTSSVESHHDDDRVFLHLGETLKNHLQADFKKIQEKKLQSLPAVVTVVEILENFVRHYAIKTLTGPQEKSKASRRMSLTKKDSKSVIDYDAISTNIDLCKEVSDGLRVYFDFILTDFLLYPEEKEQAAALKALKNFKYTPSNSLLMDIFANKKQESPKTPKKESDTTFDHPTPSSTIEDKTRRRLRSFRNEENEFVFDNKQDNLSSMASTSSGDSTMETHHMGKLMSKISIPLNIGVSSVARQILDEVFAWKMIPENYQPAEPEPSLVYGVIHLTRLVVKLPEFLSATPIMEEKLLLLLKFLDSFVEYLEEYDHLYSDQIYTLDGLNPIKMEIEDSQEGKNGPTITTECADSKKDAESLKHDIKVEARPCEII